MKVTMISGQKSTEIDIEDDVIWSTPEMEEMKKNSIEALPTDENVSEGFGSILDFIREVNDEGFWVAVYGKPFFEVMGDFFAELGKDIMYALMMSGDLFFLLPAIFLMFITFLIGSNKYTRFIIPLWLCYFLTTFFKNFFT